MKSERRSKISNPQVRLFMDSRKQWAGLAVMLLFALMAGVFKTATASLWGQVVDLGVAARFNDMYAAAGFLLLFVLLDAVRTGTHYMIIGRTTERMFFNFRRRAFTVLAEGEVGALEEQMRSGDVAMRLNHDIEQLCDIIAGNYSQYSRLIAQALFAVVVCFLLSWQLSLIFFALLPFSLWLFKKISMPIQEQKGEELKSTGRAMSLSVDVMNGLYTVKSFNLQGEMNRRFDILTQESYRQSIKTEKIGMRMTVVKYTVNVVQMMALILVGTVLVRNGVITIGSVMSFVALSAYVTDAFSQMDFMIRHYRNATGISKRLYEVFDLPMETDRESRKEKETAAYPVAAGEYVSAKDLSFSYHEGDSILKNLNLCLNENMKIALIGPSGCGKSTFIKLLCRFYIPTRGSLRVFGKNSGDLSLYELRRDISIVTQDSVLFDGSIYDNVHFGRIDAGEDEVVQALKDAELWEYVSTLADGMYTQVGEFGGRLSGGQRQRVCIARAMLKNARIVLLDEPTSALDTQTEREVQKALDRLLVGKSAVIVAHRLSTVQNVDYIYCMENGAVREEGTPAGLLAGRGYYYEMCRQQGLLTEGGAV